MRKTFQFWLFISVALVFLLTLSLSFFFQTRQANKSAVNLMKLKIDDTIAQIKTNRRNREAVRDIVRWNSSALLRSFGEIIRLDPAILEDGERMAALAETLGVEELHVSDEKGILIASVPSNVIGYDMNSQDQSRAFMKGIEDPDFLLIQDPMPRGVDQELFQYIGSGRKDRPGIIQIGYVPKWFYQVDDATNIKNLAAGFRIGKNGTILVARSGRIVSVDDERWLGRTVAEFGIPEDAVVGKAGSFPVRLPKDHVPSKAAGRSVPSRNETEKIRILCLYKKFDDCLIFGILPEDEMYISRDTMVREIIFVNLLLFLVVFALVSALVDRIVIRGIHRVNQSLDKITGGNLDEKVEVRTNPEFVSLSDGINSTVTALKKAIAETAARIDKELEFARGIQLAALPVLSPYPFPDRKEFAFFATMDTAKEVGGDFYDFLMIDDDHLALVIADVSGKGIPASLFMMKAKTVLRNFAENGENFAPAEIMKRSNTHLSENNASSMFVTTFLAVLEISSGRLTMVNAGHNPPVLIRRSGKADYLDVAGGVILGAIPDADYAQSEITLEPGDRIYLYTDGVSEAFNRDKEMFGEERLLTLLQRTELSGTAPEAFLRFVRRELLDFTQGAVQSDDITMMVLEFQGKQDV